MPGAHAISAFRKCDERLLTYTRGVSEMRLSGSYERCLVGSAVAAVLKWAGHRSAAAAWWHEPNPVAGADD